jgi:hypothetical protein
MAWQLHHDINHDAWVLSDGTRKAWFAVDIFRLEQPLLMQFRRDDPLGGLAAMMQLGLRPYRVEGDFAGLTKTELLEHHIERTD